MSVFVHDMCTIVQTTNVCVGITLSLIFKQYLCVHCADVTNMHHLNLELIERHQICFKNINGLDNNSVLAIYYLHLFTLKLVDVLLGFATVLILIGLWTFARLIERLLHFIVGFLLAC